MSENLPVIFIRKAGPGGYSLQSGKRHSISTGLVDLPAVSLYYKFKTVLGMSDTSSVFCEQIHLASLRYLVAMG